MSDEAVRKLMFSVQEANHFLLFDEEYSSRRNRSCCPHPKRHTRQASLPEEIALPQKCDNCFLAPRTDDRELHSALLNVQHIPGGITLSIDPLRPPILRNCSGHTGRTEES